MQLTFIVVTLLGHRVCCSFLQSLYESPVFKRCCVFKKELRSEIIATIKVRNPHCVFYSFTQA